MGLPVRHYSNTDAGAPIQQPVKPSDWLAIFKAVLVNGYGTTPSLGWTLEYEDTTNIVAVFRQSMTDGGSGWFFKVWSVGGDGAGTDIRIDAGKGHDGAGNLVERLGYRQLNLTSVTSTPATNFSAVAGWQIVGCSRGFWANQVGGGATVSSSAGESSNIQWYFFAGDIDAFDQNDAGKFTIVYNGGFTTIGDNASTTWTSGSVSGSDVGGIMYAADGASTRAFYKYVIPYTTNVVNGDPGQAVIPITITAIPLIITVSGTIQPNHQYTSTPSFPRQRGNIPGLFELPIGGRDIAVPGVRTFNGDNYIPCRGYYTPAFWIKSGGEWYA